MGTIIVEKLWSDGMGLYAMWLYDEIAGCSDLSTSYDQDFIGIERESTWAWFYGATMIFIVEELY